MTEITNKNYKETYILVSMITNTIRIKNKDDKVIEKELNTLIGIDVNGDRQVLGLSIYDKLNNHYYLDLFETIKSKGVKNIYFFSSHEYSNIKKSLKISFPTSIWIDSLTMNIIYFWKYLSLRGRSQLVTRLKDMYVQNNFEDASIIINFMREEYQNNQLLLLLFDKYFKEIKSYYQYDLVTRKFLFNHYSYTNIYDIIKRTNQKEIELLDSFLEKIKLKLLDLEKNRLYNKQEWCNIINHCFNYFPELVREVEKEL